MRKSAVVVTLMQQNSDITLLYPHEIEWKKFENPIPDVPFSEDVVDYLNALSSHIMKDRRARLYPDVITFAFFCRKANLQRMKEEYKSDDIRLGRGFVFHIAPSNVPVNFAYSLVAGLLSGNYNVVRASSKQFKQIDIILEHMLELLDNDQYINVGNRFAIVRYGHDTDWNRYFSSICNARIVWGGDNTIATLRGNPLPPRSIEVNFADRYSISAINPKTVVTASDKEIEQLAFDFYNDTYLFDQNACSAPHTIFWLKSNQAEKAKKRFWTAVHSLVEKKYDFQSVLAVDKLTAFYTQAANMKVHRIPTFDNKVVLTELDELPSEIDKFRCAGGYFSEYDISSLDDIAPVINVKYQTMSYYGFTKDELKSFVLRNRPVGLDRIVPIGQTTAFALKWDGFNLIETLSRISSIL